MATINSKHLINILIANNGRNPEEDIAAQAEGLPVDPDVVKIVEYTNFAGQQTWGVVWANELPSSRSWYEQETEYIREPKVIWEKEKKK